LESAERHTYLHTLKTGNATDYKKSYVYSIEKDIFITYGYYVKSQVFKLSTGKLLNTIWGHPTYMKGYKDKLYNDCFDNFGMYKIKFSPKSDYLIGSADQCKYVAWKLPKFTRIELIPSKKILKKLKNSQIVYFNNHKFLTHRGMCGIREIGFIDNGKYFYTNLNSDLLIWNSEFEHIDTIENIGIIDLVNDNMLLRRKKEEFVLYQIRQKVN